MNISMPPLTDLYKRISYEIRTIIIIFHGEGLVCIDPLRSSPKDQSTEYLLAIVHLRRLRYHKRWRIWKNIADPKSNPSKKPERQASNRLYSKQTDLSESSISNPDGSQRERIVCVRLVTWALRSPTRPFFQFSNGWSMRSSLLSWRDCKLARFEWILAGFAGWLSYGQGSGAFEI